MLVLVVLLHYYSGRVLAGVCTNFTINNHLSIQLCFLLGCIAQCHIPYCEGIISRLIENLCKIQYGHYGHNAIVPILFFHRHLSRQNYVSWCIHDITWCLEWDWCWLAGQLLQSEPEQITNVANLLNTSYNSNPITTTNIRISWMFYLDK